MLIIQVKKSENESPSFFQKFMFHDLLLYINDIPLHFYVNLDDFGQFQVLKKFLEVAHTASNYLHLITLHFYKTVLAARCMQ